MDVIDRPAHEINDEDGIEITPEMVAAGEDVLLCELGGAVSVHWWPDELAKKVFLAMIVLYYKGLDSSGAR